MAAKLASRADKNELLASDRYFAQLKSDLVLKSCGCCNGKPSDDKVDLWEEIDLSEDEVFDFAKAYRFKSIWCAVHGEEYCSQILKLDEE